MRAHRSELEALGLSLRVALVAVLAICPSPFRALLLARCRFRGKPLVDGLIHLPRCPVARGYLLISFGTRARRGLSCSRLRYPLRFSWTGRAGLGHPDFPLRAPSASLEAGSRTR
jgi:molybdate transport system permease protein